MKILLSALALAVSAAAVQAQDSPPQDSSPQGPLLQGAPGLNQNAITLQQALDASLRHNPQLGSYSFRRAALAGARETARLRPETQVQVDVENIGGSGNYSGVDAAELTLSFASLLELNGQRASRIAATSARQQQLASEQRVALLDVVAAVTSQFVNLLAAQERVRLAQEAQQLAHNLVTSLTKRVQAGSTPQAELMRARAAQAHTQIAVDNAQASARSAALQLSAYWADASPAFTQARGDLFALTNPGSLLDWQRQLDNNPDLRLLADTTRLRTAELRSAQAEGKATMGWRAGIRHWQDTDEQALVLGVDIPLASGRRARGALQTALAEQDAAQFNEDSAKIQLEARLNQTYSAHRQAWREVQSLREQVLPLMQDANRATAHAFEQGRYSSLELAMAQRELLDARAELIDAALYAHQTRIELERLTAAAQPTESEVTP